MTVDGPSSRELVAARDRSGGQADGSERRSPATYPDPVVLALAAIVKAADAHHRRKLRVVRSEPE